MLIEGWLEIGFLVFDVFIYIGVFYKYNRSIKKVMNKIYRKQFQIEKKRQRQLEEREKQHEITIERLKKEAQQDRILALKLSMNSNNHSNNIGIINSNLMLNYNSNHDYNHSDYIYNYTQTGCNPSEICKDGSGVGEHRKHATIATNGMVGNTSSVEQEHAPDQPSQPHNTAPPSNTNINHKQTNTVKLKFDRVATDTDVTLATLAIDTIATCENNCNCNSTNHNHRANNGIDDDDNDNNDMDDKDDGIVDPAASTTVTANININSNDDDGFSVVLFNATNCNVAVDDDTDGAQAQADTQTGSSRDRHSGRKSGNRDCAEKDRSVPNSNVITPIDTHQKNQSRVGFAIETTREIEQIKSSSDEDGIEDQETRESDNQSTDVDGATNVNPASAGQTKKTQVKDGRTHCEPRSYNLNKTASVIITNTTGADSSIRNMNDDDDVDIDKTHGDKDYNEYNVKYSHVAGSGSKSIPTASNSTHVSRNKTVTNSNDDKDQKKQNQQKIHLGNDKLGGTGIVAKFPKFSIWKSKKSERNSNMNNNNNNNDESEHKTTTSMGNVRDPIEATQTRTSQGTDSQTQTGSNKSKKSGTTATGTKTSTSYTSEESLSSRSKKKIAKKVGLIYEGLFRQFWMTLIAFIFFIIDIFINTLFQDYQLLWLFMIQCIITVTVNFLAFRDSHVFVKHLYYDWVRPAILCMLCWDYSCLDCCKIGNCKGKNCNDIDVGKCLGDLMDYVCCMSGLINNDNESENDSSESELSMRNRSNSKSKSKSKSGSHNSQKHNINNRNRRNSFTKSHLSAIGRANGIVASINQTNNGKEDSFIRYPKDYGFDLAVPVFNNHNNSNNIKDHKRTISRINTNNSSPVSKNTRKIKHRPQSKSSGGAKRSNIVGSKKESSIIDISRHGRHSKQQSGQHGKQQSRQHSIQSTPVPDESIEIQDDEIC